MDPKSLNNRVYTKFSKHINNANETINADHINKLQSSIVSAEESSINLHDAEFVSKVLFSFDNNLYVNSLFCDEVNEKKYLDFSLSSNMFYDEIDRSLSIDSKSISGTTFTINICSTLGEVCLINDFFLVTDDYIPAGANVKYYLINDSKEMFPIKPNEPKLPCHFVKDVLHVSIKVVMTKNALGESPKVYGLALMFYDAALEKRYGILDPNINRFHETSSGLTILTRDRAQEDKLVKVTSSSEESILTYNPDGTLDKVTTTYVKDKAVDTDVLNYGEYLDSKNVKQHVVLSIMSTSVAPTTEEEVQEDELAESSEFEIELSRR